MSSNYNYIIKRLKPQLSYYSKKSSTNKHLHYLINTVIIVLSALLPFLSGRIKNDIETYSLIIGLIGITLAILSSINVLFKFKEKWIKYRSTAETIKKEEHMFLSNSGFYNSPENRNKFETRIEEIISMENTLTLLEEKSKSHD